MKDFLKQLVFMELMALILWIVIMLIFYLFVKGADNLLKAGLSALLFTSASILLSCILNKVIPILINQWFKR